MTAPVLEHDDGIHDSVPRRRRRDGCCLVGHANARAGVVHCHPASLHCDLSASRQRRPDAVVLNRPMTRSLAITLNALGLYAIALVLLVAFGAQLILQELPCPLCLLQRIQFAMLAVGPILNVRFRPPTSHYAVSLFTPLARAAFAAREILLHLLPGDPGSGSALPRYHHFSWAPLRFA